MQALAITPPTAPAPAPKLRVQIRQLPHATGYNVFPPGSQADYGPVVTNFDVRRHGGLFDVLTGWRDRQLMALARELETALTACPVELR